MTHFAVGRFLKTDKGNLDSRQVLKILLSLALLFCNALWMWEADLTVSDDCHVRWFGPAAAANIAVVLVVLSKPY